MPPPRLSRHLRPCHPPWSAHQVRCAPESPRRKSSIAHGDALQSAASPTKPTASWWRLAINSIASSGFGRGSEEKDTQSLTLQATRPVVASSPTAPSPPPLAPSSPTTTTVETKERAWTEGAGAHSILESVHSSGTITTTTKYPIDKRPAQSQPDWPSFDLQTSSPLPAQALQSIDETQTDGEGASESNSAAHTNVVFERAKTAQRTSQLAKQQATVLLQNVQLQQAEGDTRTPHSLPKHSARRHTSHDVLPGTRETATKTAPLDTAKLGISPLENRSSTNVEHPALLSNEGTQHSQNQEHATIQLKLQELLSQVKLLQDKLDKSSAASPEIATHGSASLEQSKQPTLPELTGSVDERPNELTQSAPRSPKYSWGYYRVPRPEFSPLGHIIFASLSRYRSMAWQIRKVHLTLQNYSSPGVKSIADMIRSRLCEMAMDPFLKSDNQMKMILCRYKKKDSSSAVLSNAATSSESTETVRSDMMSVRDGSSNRAHGAAHVTMQPTHSRYMAPRDYMYRPSDVELHEKDSKRIEEVLGITSDQRLHARRYGTMSIYNREAEVNFDTLEHGQLPARHIHTESDLMNRPDSLESNAHADFRTQTQTQKLFESTANTVRIPVSNTNESSKLTGELQAKPTSPQVREASEQSLLEELFPEASCHIQSHDPDRRNQYPKLDLPDSIPLVRRSVVDRPQNMKEQVVASFQKSGEQITVLQLIHCSTELTESDFRQLIPKGKHIESWVRNGEFYKIIPGRDPLSLERLPFYYLLFKTPESALVYQKNASRLHKLSALHGSSSIYSAIPPPKGFLEAGEDLATAISSYRLVPTTHELRLHTVMQPYNPALRAIIERGGYNPVVPNVDKNGKRIYKVLVYIEGYEPSQWDLYQIFMRHAYEHGIIWPLYPESSAAIHRLREVVNLKTRFLPVSSANPRASSQPLQYPRVEYDDPNINSLMVNPEDESSAKEINQLVMNRVYNRWIIHFAEEDAARRFAAMWHRKVLPELVGKNGKAVWTDAEGVQMCNCEFLW